MRASEQKGRGIDLLTVIAIALVAYAITNLGHEGLGHGGFGILAGGHLRELSAVHVSVPDLEASGSWGDKLLAAGGTIVNLIFAAIALVLFQRERGATPRRFFLWLFATLNLLLATGYFLFSGILGVGDWAAVISGYQPDWLYQILLIIVGLVTWIGTILLSIRLLIPMLGTREDRPARTRTLTLIPYIAGGLLFLAACLPNPHLSDLFFITLFGVFGAPSGLAWICILLTNTQRYPGSDEPPLTIPRNTHMIAAAVVISAIFIGVFGPTLFF
jgi:hypothetical protein